MDFSIVLVIVPALTILGLAILTFLFKAIVWYANVNSDRNNFNAFMDEVRKDIKEILSRLGPKVVAEDSPKKLTDLGKEVSGSIGDKAFIEDLAQEHHKQLRTKTRYQIQSFCDEFIMDEYKPDDDIQTRFDDAAFDHGLDMRHIHLVVSVLLRDRIFELLGRQPVN